MNTWKILRAQDRANAARLRLNDWKNPPEKIVCPPGMRSWQYEGLIDKLTRNERFIEQQILKGLKPKERGK